MSIIAENFQLIKISKQEKKKKHTQLRAAEKSEE